MPPTVTSALGHPSEPDGRTSQRLRRAAKSASARSGTLASGPCGKHASASAWARRPGSISASTVLASALGRERLRSSRNAVAIVRRRQVERDRIALPPVRGDLKNGRPGEAAVREQNVFTEALSRAGHDRLQGNAGEKLLESQRLGRGLQWHQPGPMLGHAQAEATGNVIGKTSRPHFRNRKAAGRQNNRRGGEASTAGLHTEAVGAGNIRDGAADPHIDTTLRAFGQQHGDDLARRAIAEQLAECFLVIGDGMALNQRDEVSLRVAAQRRSAEVRVAGQKVVRRAVEIGKITASAA